MKRYLIVLLALTALFSSCEQSKTGVERPKLVVGIVIDQMRWDYLYRYSERYGNDGFKRLLSDGYSCENTMVNYLPSFTAPGHTCIYTGSVPAIHGIAGNYWTDNQTGIATYCVDDTSVYQPGDATKAPSMSPRNLLTTTITDELRLATNFRSRVYGIAIKDRGAILPAGHTANAAYWYNDKTGDFVTSTYYDKQFQSPVWLQAFNKRNIVDSLVKQNWNLLYDPASYAQSTKDSSIYEDAFKGENSTAFPHIFNQLAKADRMAAIKTMPAGNAFTLMMAQACIEGADGGKLGSGKDADFLCVSLSSTDYVGHQFGPNAMEIEDTYLRLDQQLADFFTYLDRTVGKGNYLLFLTADHGAAHNPQFLKDRNIPGGAWFNVMADLNSYLKDQFKKDSPMVRSMTNYQVYLNEDMISSDATLSRDKVKSAIHDWLLYTMAKRYNVPVSYVIDMEDINKSSVPEPIRTMAINGYNHLRSGALQIILAPGWFEANGFTGTTHGTWNPYDAHIPLLWYGWHVPHGKTNEIVNMTDISATLAAMLHIQQPNGCVGKPILPLLKTQNN
jgi:predicted AlkP superfamily pyrophosphatase or phosphodiesterase